MKKIFIFAGIVLFFVLVVMCWVFFGNFFDYAKDLGHGSQNIVQNEKTKFFGTWETPYYEDDNIFVGFNGIYQFNSDGTGSVGGLASSWNITDEKLVIYYNEGESNLTYDYLFTENGNTLTLTNLNGSLEFTKKQI